MYLLNEDFEEHKIIIDSLTTFDLVTVNFQGDPSRGRRLNRLVLICNIED